MTELLAPAGSISRAYAAINSGADAIYLGLKSFSARASADNFGNDELKSLCRYAHALGVRVHVALNTLVKQAELNTFIESAVFAHNAGADAIIIQDIFLGKYLKATYPQIHLHLSTQAGVNNVYGAYLAKDYGFDRVILARETPFEEINKIAKIIQTEVFIQGALCTCFSGQCYLSSFAGGNSGNRGRCKQPCRKLYSIDRQGFGERAYALSLSDLSVGEDILKFVDAGVYSFKIEGRMRRPEYVSAAVKYYRSILDGHHENENLSALKRTYNRGNYTKGLAFGQDKTFISRAVQGHIGEFCGIIKVIDGKYVCHSTMQCAHGDAFKILRGGKEVCGATYSGHAKNGFYLSSGTRLLNGDKAFITTDARLNVRLLEGKKLRRITVSVKVVGGNNISAVIDGREYFSQHVAERAVSRAIGREDIIKCFSKVDTYPFEVSFADIEISGEPFVPVSLLNEFRRQAYAEYFDGISKSAYSPIDSVLPLLKIERGDKNCRIAVIARDFSDVHADIAIYKPDDYLNFDCGKISAFKGEKYLYVPPYINGEVLDSLADVLSAFDGIYCDGYWAVEYCRRHNKRLFAGSGFNIANSLSLSQFTAQYVALSKELTFSEAQPIVGHNTFYLSAGDIKVMDLIYCPFGKTCKTCDRRSVYTLTDESGRVFPMRRYKTDRCAFELYNCASLVAPQNFTGKLIDCTLSDAVAITALSDNASALKNYFKNYTSGHSNSPVL